MYWVESDVYNPLWALYRHWTESNMCPLLRDAQAATLPRATFTHHIVGYNWTGCNIYTSLPAVLQVDAICITYRVLYRAPAEQKPIFMFGGILSEQQVVFISLIVDLLLNRPYYMYPVVAISSDGRNIFNLLRAIAYIERGIFISRCWLFIEQSRTILLNCSVMIAVCEHAFNRN